MEDNIFDENTRHIKWMKECEAYRSKENKEGKIASEEDILKHEYSKFNLNQIGRSLAALLTEVEKKEYYYMRGNNFVTFYSWEKDFPENKEVKYTTAVISPNPNRKLLVTAVHRNEFVFPDDTIVLSNSEKYEDEVYFYDENGNFLIKNYQYIKEYIDKLIEDRIKKDTEEKGKLKKLNK